MNSLNSVYSRCRYSLLSVCSWAGGPSLFNPSVVQQNDLIA